MQIYASRISGIQTRCDCACSGLQASFLFRNYKFSCMTFSFTSLAQNFSSWIRFILLKHFEHSVIQIPHCERPIFTANNLSGFFSPQLVQSSCLYNFDSSIIFFHAPFSIIQLLLLVIPLTLRHFLE